MQVWVNISQDVYSQRELIQIITIIIIIIIIIINIIITPNIFFCFL